MSIVISTDEITDIFGQLKKLLHLLGDTLTYMGKAHEDLRQTVHDLLQCYDHLLSLLHGLHLLDRISGIRGRSILHVLCQEVIQLVHSRIDTLVHGLADFHQLLVHLFLRQAGALTDGMEQMIVHLCHLLVHVEFFVATISAAMPSEIRLPNTHPSSDCSNQSIAKVGLLPAHRGGTVQKIQARCQRKVSDYHQDTAGFPCRLCVCFQLCLPGFFALGNRSVQ